MPLTLLETRLHCVLKDLLPHKTRSKLLSVKEPHHFVKRHLTLFPTSKSIRVTIHYKLENKKFIN